MMNCGIYKISFTDTDGIYVGSSVNIKRRWITHKSKLRNNKHHSSALQRAFDKYGESTISLSLLILCSPQELELYEQIAIDNLVPRYNMKKTSGGGLLGFRHTQDTKDLIRINNIGKKISKESIGRMSVAQKGNKNSLGRILTPITKAKISTSLTGKIRSEESKKKQSESMTGKTRPIESIRKGLESHTKRTPEQKAQSIQKQILSRGQRWEICSAEMKMLIWSKADVLYDYYKIGNDTKNKLSKFINCRPDKLQTIISAFDSGWCPSSDINWQKEFKQ